MTLLHPTLLPAQQQLPRDTTVHLLTRHSIREEPDNQFADASVPLTAAGIQLARQWGGQIMRPFAEVYTSPVARCVDTATEMLAGSYAAGISQCILPPVPTPILVEPGCYVTDVKQAGPLFFQLGAKAFINRYLTEPVPGMLTPTAGLAKMASYLYQRQAASDSVVLHVTHDTILAAFVTALLGKRQITDEDWPWMMEGLWCWFDDQGLHWIWRGQQGMTPLLFSQDGCTLADPSFNL